MAESETEQILDGIEPQADAGETAEGTEEAAVADTAAGDSGDEGADAAAGDEGQETVDGDGAGEEKAASKAGTTVQTARPSDEAFTQAVSTLEGLQQQQTALDAQLEQLDKDIADGKIDSLDAGPRIQVLTARQNRLERQISAATNAVNQQQKAITEQQEQALQSHWTSLGEKYRDIAETPEKATEMLQTIWDEEYAKAQRSMPGGHAERVAGKAEAAWENRIAVLRAQKGKSNPSKRTAPNPPGRLTPGTGSGSPTSKESSAVVAERTLGPLSQYRI